MKAFPERLAWYTARARAMSPRELAWRAGSRMNGALAACLPAGPVLAEGIGWADAFQAFRDARDRPVLLDGGRAKGIADAHPADVGAVLAAADAALDRRFAYFGQTPVAYSGSEIDWNLDARTGHRWPLVTANAIDHRTEPGDPKWIWELNRLQHLPWMAQAWLFTGESRYADGALEQLDSWIRQNPPGRGIAWRGGFEAGIRAISVAVALQGLRDAPGLTVDRYRSGVSMLAAAADLCWRGRSRFSSANNHLLGEMVGLLTIAVLHPELAGSAQAASRASAVLAREAGRQILPDGSGAEQSSAYHIFCADLLVVPAVLLARRDGAVPVPIIAALRRSSSYLRALGTPLPRYGDDDGGFCLRLHADPLPRLERHFAAAAAVTGEGPAPDLAAAWFAPDAPVRSAPQPPADLYAADGGFVVLRRGAARITMDVGPLGYLSIAAHGHADALAVTLTSGGQEIVGDPGTGGYYSEPRWRDAFRGTRAHATASVDDLDQSVTGGAFLWVRHAVTTVRAVDLGRGIVEAEHDGYTRLREQVTHRRYLVAPPGANATLVVDVFTGSGTHRVRTAWPLHPDLSVRTEDAVHVVERDGAVALRIATTATAPASPWAMRGDTQERLGWWSHRFESRTPAWLVGVVIDRARMPLVIATVLGSLAVAPEMSYKSGMIRVSWHDGVSPSQVRIDTRTPGAVSVEREGAVTER